MMGYLAEATVTAPDVSATVETIKGLLGSVFTVENLVPIIAGALGLCVGFVIFWFGYRFISRKVQKSMKKGSL